MRVLSLFDGISGARQALKELNIDCEYYASEIDKYAMQISKANYPDIVQMGDVRNVGGSVIDVDLLIGGSPCQDLSIAGNGKGLEGKRSGLFFEYLRILNKVKPRYFVLENVASMKAADRDIISKNLGIEPIMINSALLTAQQRKRYYWVGKLFGSKYEQVKIQQPEDKSIILKDILESGDTEKLKSYAITATYNNACPRDYFLKSSRQLIFNKPVKLSEVNKGGQGNRVYSIDGKSICLSANSGGLGAKTGLYEIKDLVRKLTVTECERLQGFPANYCSGVSKTQAYKALGNSFTVPVIKHILSTIFKN